MVYVVKTKFDPRGKKVEEEHEHGLSEDAQEHARQLKKKGWKVEIWMRGNL